MRKFCTTIAAASLFATSAYAAGAATSAPLPSGQPAGLKVAQNGDDTFLFLIGGTAVIAGLIILANNHKDHGGSSSSTGSTGATL